MHIREHEQGEFARCVLDQGRTNGLPRLTARPGADPYARVNVYRHNTYASLTATLLAVFPVTVRLVDERYFRYAAHRFIASFPPSEPRLSQFGGAFPRFLKGFEQLASMPFVAETARLEWVIATALDRPELTPVPLSSVHCLERPEQAVLRLQPSMLPMISRWPVFSIWTAHQAQAEPDLGFVTKRMAERVVLWRSGANIRLRQLDAAQHLFIRELSGGATLEQAAAGALGRDRLFDLATALAKLFGDGLVAGITLSQN